MMAGTCLYLVVVLLLYGFDVEHALGDVRKQEEVKFEDKFYEELFLTPLSRGFLASDFQFTTIWDSSPESDAPRKHFRLFPKSLGEILDKYHVREVHLSFTQGHWKHNLWGYPSIDAPPGVELWAWFQNGTENINDAWNGLCNALSGLFCASLNFIDVTTTVVPRVSFRPQGLISDAYERDSSHVRYATLPREVVCTENLTPWKKLLPCGVSDIPCSSTAVEFRQTLSLVSELAVEHGGKQDWSFKKLFDGLLFSYCPVATSSAVYVDLSRNGTDNEFVLSPPPLNVIKTTHGLAYAFYDLARLSASLDGPINLAATYKNPTCFSYIPKVHLTASRYIKGYGQESGVIHSVIRYSHPMQPLRIVYLEQVLSFAKVYSHTFRITVNGKRVEPEYFFVAERLNRREPFHLEVILTLPPKSVTEITVDFDKSFLKWTAYPPDANHGFYIGPSVISTVLPSAQNYSFASRLVSELHPELHRRSLEDKYFLVLHTDILLLSVPTPDFSMPYNVICLVCTVVALAFGPLHNITTKRLMVMYPDAKSGVLGKICCFVRRFRKSKTE